MSNQTHKFLPLFELGMPSSLTLLDIQNVNHPLNIKGQSGKRKGMGVMIGDTLYMATGSEPDSEWKEVGSSAPPPMHLNKDQLSMENVVDFLQYGRNHGDPTKPWTRDFQVDIYGGESGVNTRLVLYPIKYLAGRSAGWLFDNKRNAIVSPANWRLHDNGKGMYGLSTYLTAYIENFPAGETIEYKKYTVRRPRGSATWEVVPNKYADTVYTLTGTGDKLKLPLPDKMYSCAKDGFPPDTEFNIAVEFLTELPVGVRIYLSELDNTHPQWAKVYPDERNCDYSPVDVEQDHGGGYPTVVPIPPPPPPPPKPIPDGFTEFTPTITKVSGSGTISGTTITSTEGETLLNFGVISSTPSLYDVIINYGTTGETCEVFWVASGRDFDMPEGASVQYQNQTYSVYYEFTFKIKNVGTMKDIRVYVKKAA